MNALSPRNSQVCRLCGSDLETLYEGAPDLFFSTRFVADYGVCSAEGCRTVQQNPLPLVSELASYYESYYTHDGLTLPQRFAKLLGAYAYSLRLRLASRATPGWVAPKRLLESESITLEVGGVLPRCAGARAADIGCGSGENMLRLRGFGYKDVRGVEFDEASAKQARRLGFDVRVGNAESLPFESDSLDLVYSRHVLEHAVSPEDALREALRVLKPGGHLSLVTPNPESELHEEFGVRWRGLESPRHLYLFTCDSLARLFEKTGFEIVRLGTSRRSSSWMRDRSTEGGMAFDRLPSHSRATENTSALRRLCNVAEERRGEEIFAIGRKRV